jgi:uncharacterized protein YceH (UPF0502 family)
MAIQLSAFEQRVIGCLIEKEVTTPEQYPLSLNSLTNACNQKSNREPVLNLSEADVQDTLTALADKHLVMVDEGFSGRVNKYSHRFCGTEFSKVKLNKQQRAIACLMLLRGPQTPGELRTRSNRLADFSSVQEVEAALEQMIANEQVVKLEREPGKRESRYMHLFGDADIASFNTTNASPSASHNDDEVAQLRDQVAALRSEIEQIKAHLGL